MNKDILLIDVDSLIPNLALMKISTYHKDKGDNVGFNINNPDIVYASVIFTDNKHDVDGLKFWYPNAEIRIGGSGYDLSKKLPKEVEFSMPDYSLYPDIDYSLGFTTRGCIRKCDFCVVPKKEGSLCRWQHPKNFYNDDFTKIKFLDNNILADKEWFMEITEWVLEKDLLVEFNQGLDVRLIDREIAKRLKELRHFQTIKFAWDNMEDEKYVRNGIKILKELDFDIKHHIQFYVLTNYNTTHEEDLYRCIELKKMGTNPFVMIYGKADEFIKNLARWANRKHLFWSMPLYKYERLPTKYLDKVKQIYDKYTDKKFNINTIENSTNM